MPFDARVLGRDFATLSAPLPEFTVFGGMMVDRTDIGHLLGATRSLGSFSHAARMLVRHGADRLRHRRGTRLVMGNALAGRLFYSLKQRSVPVLTATQVIELIEDNGRITGARLQSGSGTATVRCRRGVVLATGGLSRNPELRRRLLPGLGAHSPVAEGATGDGFALAAKAGGHLGANHANNAFWTPVSVRKRRDGSTAVFPHLVLDRGKPGVIAVDAKGRRFVSEATNYHAFVEAMLAAGASPCHLICDDAFIAKYGLGMVRPRRMNLRKAIADGYVTRASTLAELAARAADRREGLRRNRRTPQRLCRHRRRSRFRQGQRRLSAQPGRCRAHAQSLHRPDRDAAVLCRAAPRQRTRRQRRPGDERIRASPAQRRLARRPASTPAATTWIR